MTPLAARAKELALRLTSWPSVTGSTGEAEFAPRLAEALSGFDKAWAEPLPDDPFARSNVFALKRGKSRRTIVLTGHFDVVPVDDYGDLADLAFSPERLAPRLIAKLGGTKLHLARVDLESGDFIPGRGLLDMKAGLAAGLAAMEAWSGEATLLFIGVSDEEERSAGARAAVPRLKRLAEEEGLEIALVINLDSISDQGDGSKGRVVTLGSVGKQLLTAFVAGVPAHASYPGDGINAAYIAAELTTEFELAPELRESTGDEHGALPTTLCAKDLKQVYNVTTPQACWLYWNTLQHQRTAGEVLEIARTLAIRAMARVKHRTGKDVSLLSFEEVYDGVDKGRFVSGAPFLADHELDLPERSLLATYHAWGLSRRNGPDVVLGFGSIPYPAVSLRDDTLRTRIISAVAPFGVSPVHYFAGISDMSFFGEASGDLSAAAANTPIWGTGFTMPEPGGYPAINLGPWGRDYHSWLERVHAPYAFDTLPRAILAVIKSMET